MGDAMKRDEVSVVLKRVLTEVLAGDVKTCPMERPLSCGSAMGRVELVGLSLRVSRITIDFGEQGEDR